MPELISTPDVVDVLDWPFTVSGQEKPLRFLTGPELLAVASESASIGAADLADSLAVVAENIPDGAVVENLAPGQFHELFWGVTGDTVQVAA